MFSRYFLLCSNYFFYGESISEYFQGLLTHEVCYNLKHSVLGLMLIVVNFKGNAEIANANFDLQSPYLNVRLHIGAL